MAVAAVIPARMGSSRYPGKPLADIHGLPMVEHVYRRTAMSESVDDTYVATPDAEIRDAVESFGGEAIVTGSHERATDRVAEAARDLDHEIVVVMQGDEPMVYPEMLDAAVEPIAQDESVGCVNLHAEIESEAAFRDPNNVKLVKTLDDRALYFSREPIPNLHDRTWAEVDAYKQVCVIPFRRDSLLEFAEMAPTPLEQAESIDMLRLLEHGHDVHLAETEHDVHAVDTPEDHERVEAIMADDPLLPEYASAPRQ